MGVSMKDIIFVFDFFGVISSEVAPFWLNRFFDESKSVEVKSDIVTKADLGLISEQEMFNQLSILTGEKPNDILNDWLNIAVIDRRMVDFIIEIKKSHRVVLLSNAPSKFLRRLLERENLDTYFEYIVVSGDVGVVKPDEKIYRIMLDKLGCLASQTLMIDDNPKNIDGANKVGMNGLLFKDYETFIQEIKQYLDA